MFKECFNIGFVIVGKSFKIYVCVGDFIFYFVKFEFYVNIGIVWVLIVFFLFYNWVWYFGRVGYLGINCSGYVGWYVDEGSISIDSVSRGFVVD